MAHTRVPGMGDRLLLSVANQEALERALRRVLDPDEMLSPFGIRSLSRYHLDHPFTMDIGGVTARIDYEPGESTTGLFGGNSNWRGPVWFPVNYLFIEALYRYSRYFGQDLKVEHPVGSGNHSHSPRGGRRHLPPSRLTVLTWPRWSPARPMATTNCSRRTPPGGISYGSTSTSTAIPEPAWEPPTRPGGRGW